MSWLTIPSARPVAEVNATVARWRARGYKIALWRDDTDAVEADCVMVGGYPGYSVAVNTLIRHVLETDRKCEWAIAAGDDTDPDPNHTAQEIAAECSAHFAPVSIKTADVVTVGAVTIETEREDPADTESFADYIREQAPYLLRGTFGVMQPTGDRWGDRNGAYIDRVAGSAWIGREFCRRAYGGNGPMWSEYHHMYVDEELQCVALKLGVFWQRPDLTHLHNHWGRPREGERLGQAERMPAFLRHANSAENWRKMKAIFEARRAAGFPGSEATA